MRMHVWLHKSIRPTQTLACAKQSDGMESRDKPTLSWRDARTIHDLNGRKEENKFHTQKRTNQKGNYVFVFVSMHQRKPWTALFTIGVSTARTYTFSQNYTNSHMDRCIYECVDILCLCQSYAFLSLWQVHTHTHTHPHRHTHTHAHTHTDKHMEWRGKGDGKAMGVSNVTSETAPFWAPLWSITFPTCLPHTCMHTHAYIHPHMHTN